MTALLALFDLIIFCEILVPLSGVKNSYKLPGRQIKVDFSCLIKFWLSTDQAHKNSY